MFLVDTWNDLLRFVVWMAPTRRPPAGGPPPPGGRGGGSGSGSGGGGGEPPDWFREIFENEFERVLAYFLRRGFSKEDALDLTQDTFLRVYLYSEGFRREASIRTWIHEIAKSIGDNEVRRLLTKKRKAQGKVISLAEAVEDPEDHRPGVLEELLEEEEKRKLDEVINKKMPPRMRRCMMLRIHGNLKYREIAALMGTSIGTVKAQLAQAKRLLEEELGSYFDSFDW
jgi:RNA polymerase sigma factor (sigma-70 family)